MSPSFFFFRYPLPCCPACACNPRDPFPPPAIAAMEADEVRAAAASRLPAWTVAPDGRSLFRTHQTASFVAGLDWFNAIMPIAEAEGHHPDLSLVDWNRAEVRLSTHVRRSAPPLPLSLLCVCVRNSHFGPACCWLPPHFCRRSTHAPFCLHFPNLVRSLRYFSSYPFWVTFVCFIRFPPHHRRCGG